MTVNVEQIRQGQTPVEVRLQLLHYRPTRFSFASLAVITATFLA